MTLPRLPTPAWRFILRFTRNTNSLSISSGRSIASWVWWALCNTRVAYVSLAGFDSSCGTCSDRGRWIPSGPSCSRGNSCPGIRCSGAASCCSTLGTSHPSPCSSACRRSLGRLSSCFWCILLRKKWKNVRDWNYTILQGRVVRSPFSMNGG
jgi:hypothetical protein